MARKKGWYWPWLIVGFMTVVVGTNLVLVYVASSDPSFAVEQDYYQKALDWDAKRAQDRINQDLGWSVRLDVALSRNADGRVDVTARILDRDAGDIRDARVRVQAFHNARAAQILQGDLIGPSDDGTYRARMPLRRPGLWEFRIEVSRGGQLFTQTMTKELYWK